MKKILTTGSNGFIFSNYIRKTLFDNKSKSEDQKYTFASIDKMTRGNGFPNIYQNKNHTFYLGDISDTHFVDIVFDQERPDFVIHGAAESFVDFSLKDPNKFIISNVLGTQVLINASVKYKVEKFIMISTDECYGQLTNESDSPWTESSPLNPRNPYSASKAASELLVQAASVSYGLNYNITRSSNNYGPRQTTEKLIPKVIKSIVEGNKIPVYGQGLQIRDWTYVIDNCSAITTVLEKGTPNEIYNISANQECTNIELIQKICNLMGKGHELISFVEERPGHDFRYAINCDKAKALGWAPTMKLPDGLEACVQWYLNNSWSLK
jgi:dTDP-glucose 4,6-dehydratase